MATKRIVLDAGHGLDTAGKRCLKSIDPNETREWILNSRIVTKVQNKLKQYDVEVLRVDDPTGNIDVSLTDRCNNANAFKADIYCSFHHNAGINGGNGGGISVITYNNSTEATKLSEALYNSLLNAGALKGNRSNPTYDDSYLYVLKHTSMSAVLVEHGFMDSTVDTPIILMESYAEKCANGWIKFFENYLSIEALTGRNSSTANTSVPKPDIIYQVYSNGKWWPAVKNNTDYAGVETYPITAVAISLSDGTPIRYRAHITSGNWYPWVSKYDLNDYNNGYAGDKKTSIDAIEIKCDKYSINYKVSSADRPGYYSEVNDFSNDYAGVFGVPIDKLQCRIL